MFTYKLTIEYEGTHYHGWQRQKGNKPTVQGTIEKGLKKIFKERVLITGQGRIDAGAHALGQTAHFKEKRNIEPERLRKALNSTLPTDIRIRNVENPDDNFHARYSAQSRYYRYLLYNGNISSVWLRNFAYFCPYQLNITKMREAAASLIGEHDF